MAIGFGFSVSDICNGLRLAKESVRALGEQGGASSDYTALLDEIGTLQDGLRAVEELLLDEDLPHNQHVALEGAVSSCRKTIEDFLHAISKYQPHLTEAKSKGITSRFRKIKWVLCKKEDVQQFRSQIERHSSSISMLLVTLQTKQTLQARSTTEMTNTGSNSQLTTMMQKVTDEQRQCFLFVMEQNKELLRTIVSTLTPFSPVRYILPATSTNLQSLFGTFRVE